VTVTRQRGQSRLIAAPVFVASAEICDGPLEVTVAAGDAGLVEDARDRLIDLIARFDPDDPTSEISTLNSAAGTPVTCSWETLLLASLLDAAIGGEVIIDTARSTATVTPGHRLAPGRIGPGVALDMVAQDLEADGVTGAGIRLGRDVRVIGTSPYAGGWTVDVAATRWRLSAGAAVTVDTVRTDGRPDFDAVTVLADTAWEAGSLAHRAASCTADAARALLIDSGVPGLVVRGSRVSAIGLPAGSQVDLT
jgi:hypothetical protein